MHHSLLAQVKGLVDVVVQLCRDSDATFNLLKLAQDGNHLVGDDPFTISRVPGVDIIKDVGTEYNGQIDSEVSKVWQPED